MANAKVEEPEGAVYGAEMQDPVSEISRLAEQLYRQEFLHGGGVQEPASLRALLASRGMSPEAGVLLKSAVEAVFESPGIGLPPTGPMLTEGEAEVLAGSGFETEPVEEGTDPIALGIGRYASLIASSLSAAEVADRLGVNSSRIRQRLKARTIYGFKLAGDWRLPIFQFSGHRLVPGLDAVVGSLPAEFHPVAVSTWFATPNPDLVDEETEEPVTPLEWLAAGSDPDDVALLAANL